jgi:hypothetical protein
MADDRHYIGGDNYILDDLSGFKIRASKARIIPGGQTGNLAVAPSRWEPQQPQDFVQGVRDEITVALSRPRQPNQFTIIGTNVAAFTPRGGVQITVQSVTGFVLGDRLQIMLDSGDPFFAILVWISGFLIQVGNILPASVGGTESDPPENLIVDLGPSGATWFTTDTGQPATDDLGNTIFTP